MAGVRDNTVTNVVSGGIASFKSVGEVPLKSLKVNFNPIQEGDGDPSPSNVRAISGWTGLNVFHTGKNLLNPTVPISTQSASNPVVNVNPNGSITVNSRDGTSWFARDYIYLPAGTYDFYSVFGDDYTSRYILDDDNHTEYSWKNKKTVTLTKTTKIRFKAAMGTEYPVTGWLQIFKTEENYGEYLYNGTTVPVSWSDLGTVYGGYVDLIKGKLVENYGVADIDSFDYSLNTVLTGVDRYVARKPSNCKNIGSSSICPNQVSDIYGVEAIGEANANYSTWITTVFNGQIVFYVPANTYSSIEDFKTAMSGHKIYYELTTPIEYDIDPIEIKSLIGVNNIWSNADSVEAQYCALESLDIYKQRFKTNEPHLQSASGNLVSFQTDMVAPLKECKIYFEPIQASGTPSPDNVLPISGWNNIDMFHSQKNIFDFPITDFNPNYNVNGWNGWGQLFDIPLSWRGQTFVYSAILTIKSTSSRDFVNVRVWEYNNSGQPTLTEGVKIYRKNTDVTDISYVSFTMKNDTVQLGLGLFIGADDRVQNPILELGSTATEYEPYNGSTTSITLPSTYYGGWCNPLTGVGEIVYKYLHLTGNENWYMEVNSSTVSNASYLASIRVEPTGQNSGVYKPAISDKLAPSTYWAPDLYCAVINTTSRVVIGLPQELSTKEAVNNWIQSIGGIDVVWESMFPTSFSFTPINPIKTLKNQNNIWSNTNGVTEVKYWTHGSIADKRKVVWNQLAPEITSTNYETYDNTYSSVTFNDGIAELIVIQDGTQPYHSTLRTIKNIGWIVDHKYYIKQEIYPSEDSYYVFVFYTAWKQNVLCDANQWNYKSYIGSCSTTGSAKMFVAYTTKAKLTGFVSKTRNPILIDLTQMFGEGNEPSTAAEFEALCARNGIDLTQPQPYDEGTQMYWYF